MHIVQKNKWVGQYGTGTGGFSGQNQGFMFMHFVDDPKRPHATAIIAELQQQFAQIPGLSVFLQLPPLLTLGQNESRYQYSVALQDADQRADAEAERGRFDRRVVAGDDAAGLQLAHPLMDRRRGQADQSGEFGVGRPGVGPEGPNEPPIDAVDLSHIVHALPPEAFSHSDIGVFRGQRGREVVHCVSARAEP